jgi:drug/metabolite transporter (DMT)-like permease
MHLMIPLVASFVFVASLVCVQRAARPREDKTGVGAITVLFFSNQTLALAFSCFWPLRESLGGSMQPLSTLWQPLSLALFFVLGLLFTFAAVRHGDISIATPVFGLKIFMVVLLLSALGSEKLSGSMWLAAGMAATGVGLIQWTGRGRPRHVLITIVLALLASMFYAHFDVLIQSWAPAWGVGRILPITFWFVSIISLPMIPWVEWPKLKDREILFWVALTSFLTMLQAFMIVGALAYFGDAARINIIFATRGMWSVVLAWAMGRTAPNSETEGVLTSLRIRFVGASLLTLAVIIAIAIPRS